MGEIKRERLRHSLCNKGSEEQEMGRGRGEDNERYYFTERKNRKNTDLAF